MIRHKIKKLTALISATLACDPSHAVMENGDHNKNVDDATIVVTPLNLSVSRYLAAHRSHSSHASHSSHRSSSSGGGGYGVPSPTKPNQSSNPSKPVEKNREADPLGQPARPASSYPPNTNKDLASTLKDPEKRKNIVMRMQLALQFEKLYEGPVNGIMDTKTREAVIIYKKKKGLSGDMVLDAETLNLFGILGF